MNNSDPQSGYIEPAIWLERLVMLCERFSYLGVCSDIAAMNLIELWGLYCYLSRLAEECP